ncbi:hypothetical protein E2C01_095799 [Portunus trituberculatus]|uniref:Uncharacterized protein n=1 Tax=Portunus trituberculatus TaxID=210409 RepID=A0A5B7JW76_PORTR|nr:hypothetical protein [Portunus trituberculatus]
MPSAIVSCASHLENGASSGRRPTPRPPQGSARPAPPSPRRADQACAAPPRTANACDRPP